MKYKILQIYHDRKQAGQLTYAPYWNPVPNTRGTEYHKRYIFLESDVMLRCFECALHFGHDYFGVLSPNFTKKIDSSKAWGQLKNVGPHWDKKNFERYCDQSYGAPVIGFCKHLPHSVFQVAEKYHPGITSLTKGILDEIGFDVNLNSVQQQPIYFNYFLAQSDVFGHFCQTLLFPFIHYAKDVQALYQNSGYNKAFPLKDVYNVKHWPFHPFIAERLISLYVHKHKLHVATPDGR